jgi:hypothetical protein
VRDFKRFSSVTFLASANASCCPASTDKLSVPLYSSLIVPTTPCDRIEQFKTLVPHSEGIRFGPCAGLDDHDVTRRIDITDLSINPHRHVRLIVSVRNPPLICVAYWRRKGIWTVDVDGLGLHYSGKSPRGPFYRFASQRRRCIGSLQVDRECHLAEPISARFSFER